MSKLKLFALAFLAAFLAAAVDEIKRLIKS